MAPRANYTPLNPGVASAPASSKETEPHVGEKLKAYEVVEHEPSREVAPYVISRPDTIKSDHELKEAGATPIPSTKFPALAQIKLPLSDMKIEEGLHKPPTSSWRWLSQLCIYLLQQTHQTIKMVHGKVTRVPFK